MCEFKGTNETWFLSGLEIVSMPRQVKICKVSGSTYDEARANALLISKAPEMLEMLEKVLSEYTCDPSTHNEIEQLIKEATELN